VADLYRTLAQEAYRSIISSIIILGSIIFHEITSILLCSYLVVSRHGFLSIFHNIYSGYFDCRGSLLWILHLSCDNLYNWEVCGTTYDADSPFNDISKNH